MLNSAATWATATSPAACIIRVKPVGAKPNGRSNVWPSDVVLVEADETSLSTDGWNSIFEKILRARASDASLSADPST